MENQDQKNLGENLAQAAIDNATAMAEETKKAHAPGPDADFVMVDVPLVQLVQCQNKLHGLDPSGRIWVLDRVPGGKPREVRWYWLQGPKVPVKKSELEERKPSGLIKPTIIPSAGR